MDKIMKILLVEDDAIACQEIICEIDKQFDDFSLIGVTNNSEKALTYVYDSKPDAVILDLELHQGGGTGFDFLKAIKFLSSLDKPFILVTTNNISTLSHTVARELAADFIMTKNQENYSAASVLNFLKITKSVILEKRIRNNETAYSTISNEQYLKRLNCRVCAELDKIGINPRVIGYKYLTDAIILVIQDNSQNLTVQIGNKHKKTSTSVERAMQNAINHTWVKSDINVLLSQYTASISSDKGVPTITEFTHFYARKIKNTL